MPRAPTYMLGDAVQFYSRLTLQPLGAPNRLLAASASRLRFRDVGASGLRGGRGSSASRQV